MVPQYTVTHPPSELCNMHTGHTTTPVVQISTHHRLYVLQVAIKKNEVLTRRITLRKKLQEERQGVIISVH